MASLFAVRAYSYLACFPAHPSLFGKRGLENRITVTMKFRVMNVGKIQWKNF